jgi:hypothetical protein
MDFAGIFDAGSENGKSSCPEVLSVANKSNAGKKIFIFKFITQVVL